MDCRNHLILALGLLTAAGCVPQNSVQPNSPQSPPPVAEKAKELPPHPPKNPEVCVSLGNWFAEVASDKPQGSADQEKGFELARKEYQQALDIDPSCLSAYQALARLAMNRSNYTEAVKWYRKGLERMPREGTLWFNLGMCLARHKEWPQAVEALRHATECDPENKRYCGTLGFCLGHMGQLDQTLAAFEKSYGETLAHYHLARILYEMHHDAEALQHVQLVVKQEPKYEPAQHLLAQLEGREPSDLGTSPASFEEPR